MHVSPLHHLRRNAVAYLALFVALGGTSFAAATVITGKNVKDSSLTGVDVKTGSLTGSDVKNKSLAPADFNGSVQGPKGDTGAQGLPGLPGANGTNGTDGERGPSNASRITAAEVPVTLPAAGHFVLTGRVALTGTVFNESCEWSWRPVGMVGWFFGGSFNADVADGVETALPVAGDFTTTGPSQVVVDCLSSASESVRAYVIQVADLD